MIAFGARCGGDDGVATHVIETEQPLLRYPGPNSPAQSNEEVIGHGYDVPSVEGVRENEAGTGFDGGRVAGGIALGAGLILGVAILYQAAVKYFSPSQPAQMNIQTQAQRGPQ